MVLAGVIGAFCAVAAVGGVGGVGAADDGRAVTAASGPALRLHDGATDRFRGSVTVEGLSAATLRALEALDLTTKGWKRLFALYTAPSLEAAAGLPPLLGSYVIDAGAVRFTPRFPFRTGLDYTARYDGNALALLLAAGSATDPTANPAATTLRVLTFRLPQKDDPLPARVETIYPSAELLPENLLRVYVHFSRAMRAHDVHRHVRLYDGEGFEVPLPFVEIPQGLWDPGQRRLTLFLHPGRIKRGVGPHMALGPVLREGESFRLVVERTLLDAGGRPLAEPYEKRFRVGPPDRASPRPMDWRALPPGAENEPLTLRFPEALDRALLPRMIAVEDAAGQPLDGTVAITDDERAWVFTPSRPWPRVAVTVTVNAALEDLAGNRLDRLFDTATPGNAASFPAAADEGAAERIVVTRFELP